MDQLISHIALVSDTRSVSASSLARAAAAFQKQVTRDLGPIWNVLATVDAFPMLEDVPVGYWPVILRDDLPNVRAAGFHQDRNGQPFALVKVTNSWTLSASHEILEMLVDPFGNRLQAGDSIDQYQGRVEYLVEVCDPCEDDANSYRVNGVMVSDFYTPRYFDPVPASGVRYSFTGAISHPRQILRNGYLSWFYPVDGHWYQARWLNTPRMEIRDLGVINRARSLRSVVDAVTRSEQKLFDGLSPRNETLIAANRCNASSEDASSSRAADLRQDIVDILVSTRGGFHDSS